MAGSSVCIAKAGCTLYKNVQPAFALSTQKTRQKARSVIYTNTPLKSNLQFLAKLDPLFVWSLDDKEAHTSFPEIKSFNAIAQHQMLLV